MIYTIGHSTRALDDFIALLTAHGVTALADIRTVPKSRRHPHFSDEALAISLPAADIAYRHFAGLGGLRKPRRDSTNTAWRHSGFRGYADYMQTPEFDRALDELLAWRQASVTWVGAARVGMMCAEAVWWQCHRQLTADALVARGIEVRHIMSTGAAARHTLTDFARVADGRVTYPR
jgi:uncharacterized protein (DUF488 family)